MSCRIPYNLDHILYCTELQQSHTYVCYVTLRCSADDFPWGPVSWARGEQVFKYSHSPASRTRRSLCVCADLFAPHENAWVKILSSQLALIYTSLDKNRSLFELSCFPPGGPFNPPCSAAIKYNLLISGCHAIIWNRIDTGENIFQNKTLYYYFFVEKKKNTIWSYFRIWYL